MPDEETCRYFAFLRAINVGGRTIKMDRLRALVEELGFDRVETFIASGNLIIDTPPTDARALERQIEDHLRAALGYDVDTFIRTTDELAAVAARQPFENLDGGRLYVAFLDNTPDADTCKQLLARRTPVDEFDVHGREVYWLCRTSTHLSTFSGGVLEKITGTPATLRNINTVHRLLAKYS